MTIEKDKVLLKLSSKYHMFATREYRSVLIREIKKKILPLEDFIDSSLQMETSEYKNFLFSVIVCHKVFI